MEEIWSAVLPLLRERLGERNYNVWIEPIRYGGENGAVRLELPSRFSRDWVDEHFLPTICEAVEQVVGSPYPVRLVVNPRPLAAAKSSAPPSRSSQPLRERKPVIGQLIPRCTFQSFIVGTTNEMAVKAAQTVSAAPGRRFNPVFLYSGVGLGKTHLLNAVGHDLLRRWPRLRVAWLSAEGFMNDMIGSLRKDRMNMFRERYRHVDAMLLDDLHCLANKERTQEEFFHTFNALYGDGKQIVVTSDKAPSEINGLEGRLRSRFEGGLLADIQPPTREMRVGICTAKAKALGAELSPDVVDLLVQREVTSVRDLEGALTRVVATAAVDGRPITVELARSALAPWLSLRKAVSVEAIQEMVSRHYGIVVAELVSHRRDRRIVFPRQVAMYLSRAVAEATFPCIAEKFGGRDHTTVMYAVRVVAQKRAADPDVERSVAALEGRLRSQPGTAGAGC
jgi:chromosomal replication initiator protein